MNILLNFVRQYSLSLITDDVASSHLATVT